MRGRELTRNGGRKKCGIGYTHGTAFHSNGAGEVFGNGIIGCEKHSLFFLWSNLKDNFPKSKNVLLFFQGNRLLIIN